MPQKGDGGMPDLMSKSLWYSIDRVFGFEDEPEEEEETEEEESEEESEEEESEEEEDDDKKKGKGENVDGLKSALKAERKKARDATRELKKLQREKGTKDEADEKTVEQATKDATDANARSEKLATRLRKTELDGTITRAATKLKFRDIDDALSLLRRDPDWVDQDEDDPSDIEIDEDAVKAAVAKLAKDKPHLLLADGDEDPSAPKFNGRKDKSKDKLSKEALAETYPALQRRQPLNK